MFDRSRNTYGWGLILTAAIVAIFTVVILLLPTPVKAATPVPPSSCYIKSLEPLPSVGVVNIRCNVTASSWFLVTGTAITPGYRLQYWIRSQYGEATSGERPIGQAFFIPVNPGNTNPVVAAMLQSSPTWQLELMVVPPPNVHGTSAKLVIYVDGPNGPQKIIPQQLSKAPITVTA